MVRDAGEGVDALDEGEAKLGGADTFLHSLYVVGLRFAAHTADRLFSSAGLSQQTVIRHALDIMANRAVEKSQVFSVNDIELIYRVFGEALLGLGCLFPEKLCLVSAVFSALFRILTAWSPICSSSFMIWKTEPR